MTTLNSSSPTAQLASFAASPKLSASIPPKVRSLLPIYLLDVVASMLAGCVQPVYESSLKATRVSFGAAPTSEDDDTNGRHQYSVTGDSLPISGAILMNGIAAGDFEFEHVISNAHPASSVLPALLVLASHLKVSGKEFLEAMVVGYELAARIGMASTSVVESVGGFHNPGLNGALASAAACGRLMGLDAQTVASAMGIAASSSAGLMAFVYTGSMTKRLHPGRAAQLGFEAAIMAREGVEGPLNILENPGGFLHAFSPKPEINLLTEGLGTEWKYTEGMILKLSPVHAYAQLFVYAINKYRDSKDGSFDPEDIQEVTVKTGPGVMNPSHMNPRPTSLVAAQYSIRFSIAAALTADLRNPMNINDDLVANKTAQRIAGDMTFEQVTNDKRELGGDLSIVFGHASSSTVRIRTEGYPGLPGDENYAEAAEIKFDRVAKGLGVSKTTAVKLKKQIGSVDKVRDMSDLYRLIVQAGVETMANHRE